MISRWEQARERQFHCSDGSPLVCREFTDPFFFAVLADTQFGMMGNNTGRLDEEIRNAETVISSLNAMKPSFVVVCGDLVNANSDIYPDLDPTIEEKQVETFKSVMAGIDKSIPLVCVCGNHDIGNRPTPESIATYRSRFGDDYFSFWISGVKCIVLNTQLYFDSSKTEDEFKSQHAWFEAELEEGSRNQAQHILVFGHIPWFLQSGDEPDKLGTKTRFFDIEISNDYFHIKRDRRLSTLALMKRYNVRACFAGHWHQNGVAWDGRLEMIITGAVGVSLGDDVPGFRVVKVFEDDLVHKFFPLTEAPSSIQMNAKNREIW